ncbi:MAG: response regulator transcription factor [Bacteroidetes bacterium]|nr:response regulator transcription factor [Bacteroidota bacterium]
MMNKSLKIIIVEDEPLIADDLKSTVEELGHKVSALVDNANDCIMLLKEELPDLLLLDINIKGGIDGIMLADMVNKEFKIPFIFITSYTDDETLSKVKVQRPAGFLVKPFEDREVKSAIALGIHNFNSVSHDVNEVKEVTEEKLFVKYNSQLISIKQSDILWAEAYDNYCYIQIPDKRYLLPSTLKSIESRLDPNMFMRIHRSYLANLTRLDVIGDNYVTINTHELPVSKRHKADLIRRINML